ncbi:TniQ family protein [Shewanella sp. 0m-8]
MNNVELPAPFENEHIFSVLARWFDTTGRNDFLMTCKRVSNNLTILTPAAIWRPLYADLAKHYQDTIGIHRVIYEHTLVPYYLTFLPTEVQDRLLDSDVIEQANLKVLPGLQNNIKAAHHWRWCNECAKEDFDKYGITYWHTYHQIPTMLRCYKHQVPLISSCQHCDFQYLFFQRHWLPPENGRCLECEEAITPPVVLTSPTSHWLDAVSIRLQGLQSELSFESLTELMKSKIGYQSLPSNTSLALRKEVGEIQLKFVQSIEDSLIPAYFTREREAVFKQGQKLLNIVTTVYRGSQVPPISLLLMLKSLELEHELTKRVVE